MPVISADKIRGLIISDDELFIPDTITGAISQALVSDSGDISDGIDSLIRLYKDYVEYDGPTPVSYSSDATVDAYTIHYLPRNTLIPKLLFLSLAYHPAFQTIKDEVNILDLGSGTGGVALGLMDLLQKKPFSDVKANITCCDLSQLALDRQKELLANAKYQYSNIQQLCVDLTEPNTYDKVLSRSGPYDYVIAANILAELPLEGIKLLLSKLPALLASNAILLFADPPRKYVDSIKLYTFKTLQSMGLFCYYPCPPEYACPKSKCPWVWLNFEFVSPDIEIDGESLETNKSLSTTWSVFCNSNHSIYDVLQQIDKNLTWGVAVPYGREFSSKEVLDYSLCTAGGPRRVQHTRDKKILRGRDEVILRGSILGFNDDCSKIYSWHPLYGVKQWKQE